MSYYFLFLKMEKSVVWFCFSFFLNSPKFLWTVYIHFLAPRNTEANKCPIDPEGLLFYIYCKEQIFYIVRGQVRGIWLCHHIWLMLILILLAFNISNFIFNLLWNWESDFGIAKCKLTFQKALKCNQRHVNSCILQFDNLTNLSIWTSFRNSHWKSSLIPLSHGLHI